MYEGFYGFRERPFTLLPDPDFLFLDEKHRTALDLLETAVSSRSGFCVISGDIGAGKTTLIRELLNRLDETVCVGLVSNTHPSFGELLQWIMAAYGLPCGDGDKLELHKRFIEFAVQQYAQNKHTLLIIDEAQNLTMQALEELRMLSNVNSERDLVLQVILVGQQQLRDKLQQPQLEQFSQRIALSYHLQALNLDETCRYIQHRVNHAGGKSGLFSTGACQAVYRLSGGIPRLINRFCDLSLVYGCTAESAVINAELVDRVGEDQRMGTLRDIPQVDRVTEKPEETAQALEASADKKAEPEPPAAPSELHQLVVDAEQNKRVRGERGALWLLLVVVVMAGGTGWLMRDFWGAEQDAVSSDIRQQAVSPTTTLPPAVAKEGPAAPSASADSQVAQPGASLPQAQDSRQLSVADSADPVKKDNVKDSEVEEDVSVQKAAEAERAAQQRTAELRREAEKTARLKQESDRMERERRVAEQRLAKQRAARKELERKARLEREKMVTAREAAKKLAEERTRAESRLSEASAVKSSAQEPARPGKALAGFLEPEPSAYDEEDGDAIVQDTKARLASDAAESIVKAESVEAVADLPDTPPAAYDADDGDAIIQDDKDEAVEFAANPCRGPTARFLSTCR
ncbi:MAG: hypothetical protein BMS9Abin08_1007 [Gammaproteobacteria bacterium]|nr:MAG: hypothetical protein BMS9Abin08_1007 [Gammaproteobacteria bacterium]